jgi:hypothetical protein
MAVSQLCALLLGQALSINAERAKRWQDASWRVARILSEHPILGVDLQQIGRLDCVVGQLESESARLLSSDEAQHPTLVTDFALVLAKSWLSLAYEVLRCIQQRLVSRSDLRAHWTAGIADAFSKIERVRMAELKREIAKGSKLKGQVELFVPGNEHATAVEYRHGQTVLNSPLELRPTDGSIVWHAFSEQLRRSEKLYRRDMSEHLLSELERL